MSTLKAVPKVEHEQRELECTLTDIEYAQRSARMSETELQIEKLKTERSSLTRQINELAAERNELGHVLDSRRELRTVDCIWERDYGRAVAQLFRSDTREIVQTRELTPDERQQTLALVTPPAPAEDEADGPTYVILGGPGPSEPTPGPAPAPRRGRKPRTTANTHHEHTNEHAPEGA